VLKRKMAVAEFIKAVKLKAKLWRFKTDENEMKTHKIAAMLFCFGDLGSQNRSFKYNGRTRD